MDAEPGGILYLQEFFSDSVNEITFNIMCEDKWLNGGKSSEMVLQALVRSWTSSGGSGTHLFDRYVGRFFSTSKNQPRKFYRNLASSV